MVGVEVRVSTREPRPWRAFKLYLGESECIEGPSIYRLLDVGTGPRGRRMNRRDASTQEKGKIIVYIGCGNRLTKHESESEI